MMNKERSIAMLNLLIEVNNDKIDGYEKASKRTNENDLDHLFFQLMQTSKKCKTELMSEVLQLGGNPPKGINSASILFRAWRDIKKAITGRNRRYILSACEYGEHVALKAYKSALINHSDHLDYNLLHLLNTQSDLIKKDLGSLKILSTKINT